MNEFLQNRSCAEERAECEGADRLFPKCALAICLIKSLLNPKVID